MKGDPTQVDDIKGGNCSGGDDDSDGGCIGRGDQQFVGVLM